MFVSFLKQGILKWDVFRFQEFQMQTQVLYKTLKSLEKRQVGPHLEQLLTRINFNNYLSDHNGFIIT